MFFALEILSTAGAVNRTLTPVGLSEAAVGLSDHGVNQPRRLVMGALRELFDRNSSLTKLVRDESGATAIEYGLIAALIAVAAIAAMQLVGTSLTSTFNNVASQL